MRRPFFRLGYAIRVRQLTLDDYQQRIGKVVEHIERDLEGDLSIETLARVASFSPYHFHRVFRGMVGEGVKQYVKRVRLERAAFRLNFGDDPVTQVALEAGYSTHEAFTRAFRSQFGCAPKDFSRSAVAAKARRFTPPQPSAAVAVRPRAATRIAYVRSLGPVAEIEEAFGLIFAFVESAGLSMDAGGLGISYDDPVVTDPQRTRFDAAVVVPDGVEGNGRVLTRTVPPGRFAVTEYRGPYTQMHGAYVELVGQWFPRSGYAPADTGCLEFYLNDPRVTAPQDLLTEIWVRIAES